MKQKLDELARKKSLLIFVGIAVLVLGLLVFYVYSQQQAQKRAMEEKRRAAPVVVQRQEDIYKERWVAEGQQELTALKKEQEELKKKLEEEQKQKQELQTLLGQINNPPSPPPPPSIPQPISPRAVQPAPPPPPPPPSVQSVSPSGGPAQAPPQPRREIMSDLIFVQRQEKQEKAPTPTQQEQVKEETPKVEPKEERSFVIPAGSFVKVLVLSGVDAPTSGRAQASPHPVLLRIVDKAILPNLYKADVRDCFLLGSAYGDLSSERAYVRLEVLSCLTKKGDVVETPVKGYLAGEDGKVGLIGRVVTKQGQMLARALMAGFVEGIGRAFQTSTTNIVVSPQGSLQTVTPSKVFQGSLAMGFSNAASKLVEQYSKLLDLMFPIIEINAGRTVDAVFLQRVEFKVSNGKTTVSQPQRQGVQTQQKGQSIQTQQSRESEEEF